MFSNASAVRSAGPRARDHRRRRRRRIPAGAAPRRRGYGDVRIIERDPARGELLAARAPHTLVLQRRRHRSRAARNRGRRPQRRARVASSTTTSATCSRRCWRGSSASADHHARQPARPTCACSSASASTSRCRRAAPPSRRSLHQIRAAPSNLLAVLEEGAGAGHRAAGAASASADAAARPAACHEHIIGAILRGDASHRAARRRRIQGAIACSCSRRGRRGGRSRSYFTSPA